MKRVILKILQRFDSMAELRENQKLLALAHHWLVNLRGGEKVLKQFSLTFPETPIYTLIAYKEVVSEFAHPSSVEPSILKRLPGARHYFRNLLFLFPAFNASIKVPQETQLILSSDAGLIKGIRVPDGCIHVCYCHTPPRYLWELQDEYLKVSRSGLLKRAFLKMISPYLRRYDKEAAGKVDYFIANSRFVASRILKYYGRESVVIYPPVDLEAFEVCRRKKDYYLIVSELVPYKRVDIAVRAFNKNRMNLVVVGDGPERDRLQGIAEENVRFVGRLPFAEMKRYYQEAKAFVFPGLEDFGITPLEAQACGTPVIAFRGGGALETVKEGETGWFFDAQTPEALNLCLSSIESRKDLDPASCRANSERFSPEKFRTEIREFIADKIASKK